VTITRRNHGRSHSYWDDDERLPGVTTILDQALAKPALINWAGDTTAGYAVDHWDDLGEMPPSRRLDRLKRCRWEERDAAGRRGTEVHNLASGLVVGAEVHVPDELVGHVESYVDFLDTWEPEPVLVETVVANRGVRYAGTLDLVADMGGLRWLLDLKTARSGIFFETALQCTAYARAEVYINDDGLEKPMAALGIDRVGAVHVTAGGWELRELNGSEEVWTTFRHLAWLQRRLDGARDWVGASVVEVPG